MGPGRIARHGNAADRRPWSVLGNPAARLHVRVSLCRVRLRNGVSVLRLARVVCRRYTAGISRDLHSRARSRVSCLAAQKIDNQLLARPRCGPETALVTLSLRDLADDRVQRDVAWDTGPISDIFG